MGNMKRCNERHLQWGKEGEKRAMAWLSARRYRVKHMPNGIYAEDIYCADSNHYIEVERRLRGGDWPIDEFWPTVNIPERRYKKVRKRPNTLLLVMCPSMSHGFFVFPNDILNASKVTVDNVAVAGEDIYKVPWPRCCPVDFNQSSEQSIGELNANRIRLKVNTVDRFTALRMLGTGCPFGLPQEEWASIRKTFERDALPEPPKQQSGQMTLFGE